MNLSAIFSDYHRFRRLNSYRAPVLSIDDTLGPVVESFGNGAVYVVQLAKSSRTKETAKGTIEETASHVVVPAEFYHIVGQVEVKRGGTSENLEMVRMAKLNPNKVVTVKKDTYKRMLAIMTRDPSKEKKVLKKRPEKVK